MHVEGSHVRWPFGPEATLVKKEDPATGRTCIASPDATLRCFLTGMAGNEHQRQATFRMGKSGEADLGFRWVGPNEVTRFAANWLLHGSQAEPVDSGHR